MQKSLIVAAFSVVAAQAFAQNIYTWTDESGHEVYSDEPPPAGRPAKRVDGGDLSTLTVTEAVLPEDLDDKAWRDDVPACHAVLTTLAKHRADLRRAEAGLNEAIKAFQPCQHYLDVCWSKALTRTRWEKDCRVRPTACDISIDDKRGLVEHLRAHSDELETWAHNMATWGCTARE